MKLSKKLMALLVAGTMSVSALAFAACDDTNKDNNNDDKNNTTNENGTGGGSVDPTTKEGKFVNGLRELSFSAFDTSFNFSMNGSTADYTSKDTVKGSVKFDIAKGNGDIGVTVSSESTNKTTNKQSTYTNSEEIYMRDWNAFVAEREWDEATDSYKKTGNLEFEGNARDEMNVDNMELPEGIDISQILPEGTDLLTFATENGVAAVGETLSILSAFANAAGALTVSDTSATLNVNLMAYNLASDVNSLLKSFTAETTVSDVLTSNYLKKYLMVFTEMIPVSTIQAGLASLGDLKTSDIVSMLPEGTELPPQALAILSNLDFKSIAGIQPDANSTTYDYLLKIMGSTELADLLKATITSIVGSAAGSTGTDQSQMIAGMNAALAQITSLTAISLNSAVQLGFIPAAQLTQIMEEVESAKTLVDAFVKGNVTANSLTIPVGGGGSVGGDYDNGNGGSSSSSSNSYSYTDTVKVSDAKLSFTLANGKVTGLGAEAKYEQKRAYEYSDSSKNYANTMSGSVDASVSFVDTVAVADIGSKKVIFDRAEYNNVQGNIGGFVAKVVTDKNGEYKSVQICDSNGKVLNAADPEYFVLELEDGEVFVEVNAYENSYDARVNVSLYMQSPDGSSMPGGYVTLQGVKKNYENTVSGILAGTPSTEVTAKN